MATISENLQILKDSADAIKQAIIDKGGTIEGDITTWANSINNLNTVENDDTKPEIAFFSFMNEGKYAYEVGMTWGEWINSEYGKMNMYGNHGSIDYGSDGILTVFLGNVGTGKLRIEGSDEDIMISTVINKDITNYTQYFDDPYS